MINEILLSILIPTRNREKYAIQVIKHILEFNNNNFQLVIQDNSDSKNLEILLDEYKYDSRLNYFYCGNILSFVDNFNLGISNCKGQYLTIIGDDDGINPDPQTDGEGPSNNYTSEGYISNKNGIVNKSQAVR